MRFRKEAIAMAADIEEMFLQVRVPEKDRDALCFLWWPNNRMTSEPAEYQMLVHPFGATSSPFCANYALKNTAAEFENCYSKEVITAIKKNFYVDDCLVSVPNVNLAKSFVNEITDMLKQRGFRLRNWITNERRVVEGIPNSERAKSLMTLDLKQLPREKTLGLEWDADKDSFHFQFNFTKGAVTRRELLSCVSALFDPLGLVSPLLMPAKILLQTLCKKGLGWDETLSREDQEIWDCWVDSMQNVQQIFISRCIKPSTDNWGLSPQLHLFCDASESGYGAVAYARYNSSVNIGHCQILMAKARVAPIKIVTIPRLELTAAVLATRIYRVIDREMELKFESVSFWTDSTIVLHYINNTKSRFSTYVANRLSEIHEVTKTNQWRHVASRDNPADYASRGLIYSETAFDTWVHGPQYLRVSEEQWIPLSVEPEISTEDLEYKCAAVHTLVAAKLSWSQSLFSQFSSWFRLQKAVAWLTRFKSFLLVVKGLRKDSTVKVGMLTVSDLKQARSDILRLVQREAFVQEYKVLSADSSHEKVLKNGPLRKLCPVFIDGLIKVGGRLRLSTYGDEFKHQVILPSKHNITNLIIKHIHAMEGHNGVSHVLASLRQEFWVLKGATTIKGVIGKCLKCRRTRAPSAGQMMAPLPLERVSPGWFPFCYVGIDYFGPFLSKRGRSMEKRYGCIFTCLQCRAVHLEMAYDLTTDAFIMTLMRFVNRRGYPRKLLSDNGTNFVGAKSELTKCIKSWDKQKLNDKLLEHEIEWQFNPPSASHRGGVWERLIRSVRRTLNSIVSGQTLNDESIITLFTEIERILNNRPLVPLRTDIRDLKVLTPNDLLMMRAVEPMIQTASTEGIYIRRWKQINYLASVFWKRWTREYLPLLQCRQKWINRSRDFRVNDIVLVTSNNIPREQWPVGIIETCETDSDGLVRTVGVRISSGTIRRDVRNICLLEGAGEQSGDRGELLSDE